MSGRKPDQDGSVAVEAALVAPLLLVLLLLVVYAGRAAQADTDVHTAAGRAARAASLVDHPDTAAEQARAMAAANLATAGIDCQPLQVTVEVGRLHAGGSVTVTVGCRITNRDIATVAVPGTRWSWATVTHPIDVHRGGG